MITDEEVGVKGVDDIQRKTGRLSDENAVLEVTLAKDTFSDKHFIDRFELFDGTAVYVESVPRPDSHIASGAMRNGPHRLSVERILGRYDVERVEDHNGDLLGEVTVVDPDE